MTSKITSTFHTTKENQLDCQLLDSFAIGIQLLLAFAAIFSLLIKRQREKPQRPFIIWFFDVSKQTTGAAMVHFLNVLASLLSGKKSTEESNPCVWYFLNLILDTTVGVYILYLILKLLGSVVRHFRIPDMESGYYGQPPEIRIWFKQTILFMIGLLLMKLTVMITLAIFPFLAFIGNWFLAPFLVFGDPKVQVVFVMLIVPLIMNIIQFWLIDHVIKRKYPLPSDADILTPNTEDTNDSQDHFGDFPSGRRLVRNLSSNDLGRISIDNGYTDRFPNPYSDSYLGSRSHSTQQLLPNSHPNETSPSINSHYEMAHNLIPSDQQSKSSLFSQSV